MVAKKVLRWGLISLVLVGIALAVLPTASSLMPRLTGAEDSGSALAAQEEGWHRLAGDDAYGTMEAIVSETPVETGGTVVVATGDGYWDALAAAGMAGLEDAPALITTGDALEPRTASALEGLAPSRIIVVGGPASVSDACFREIEASCPTGTTRVFGADAASTAIALFEEGSGWSETCVVATSDGYWDALSIAPFCYAHAAPIFLTRSSDSPDGRVLSHETLSAIAEGSFERVVIVGGELSVSPAVENQLGEVGLGEVSRLSGEDAVATSARIALWEMGIGMGTRGLCVASTAGYWDALTGASLAGSGDAVLVLMEPVGGTGAVDAVIDASEGDVILGYVLGGPLSVSDLNWRYLTNGGWTDQERSEVEVERVVRSLTTEQKVAQLFVVQPEDLVDAYGVTEMGPGLRAALEERGIGGIALMGANIDTPDQTRALIDDLQAAIVAGCGLPALMCVDEEGGTVTRVAGNAAFGLVDAGNMRDVGSTGDPGLAEGEAARVGSYLAELGFNVDFAPVADIASGSDDFIWYRSFGTESSLVSDMVAAQVRGLMSSGVMATVKHFPGIGGAEGDSHYDRIYSYQTVEEMRGRGLAPFRSAIEAGAPLVMVGHLCCVAIDGGALPSSLSYDVVTGILREELGYDGLVITDSLGMGAVTQSASDYEAGVLALEAGCDLLLGPANYGSAYQGVLDAVESGRISQDRLDASLRRIVEAKLRLVG